MEEPECPECGSTDVDVHPDITESEWLCCECGAKFDLDLDVEEIVISSLHAPIRGGGRR